MSLPPDQDPDAEPGRGGGRSSIPLSRAVVLLVAFVVLVIVVLGVVHPSATTSSGATTTTVTTQPTSGGHPGSTTTTSTTSPAHVAVVVANGSGVSGAAAAVSAKLQPQGWNLLSPTNATSEVTATRIYYTSGFQAAANAIAAELHVPLSSVVPYTTAAPLGSIGTADVAVVVGPDVADAVTGATTTTAPGTSTSGSASTSTTSAR